MFKILNIIINIFLPFTPKAIVKIFAKRYIAGTTESDAISVVKKINKANLSATLDILGEHTSKTSDANFITNEYISLYKRIEKEKVDCNISIKPSHIGSDISQEFFEENLGKIHSTSAKFKNFLRIDMESHKLTDLTLNYYKKFYKQNKCIGPVLQAYLLRSENDLLNLDDNSNIRLCKGIYNEPDNIAYKKPNDINENYKKLLKTAFKKNIYVGIATHDDRLINDCIKIIKDLNIEKNKFEFQVLYGVPINKTIKKLLLNKFKVRVYVPYGPDWYKYSMRRLKENPNISKYIIENIFKRNFYA